MDERLDEHLREDRKALDDPHPTADMKNLLEDADQIVAAAQRRPKTEQHDLDGDEDAEQAVDGSLQTAIAGSEDGDEVLKG
jgi:hypothetical protein